MLFNITSAKKEALLERMAELGLREKDIIEKFIKGTGKGGQKINKTLICVYLKHMPTGIEVRCQRERSQSTNRFLARRMLCEHLENIGWRNGKIVDGEHGSAPASPHNQKIEKVRRQKQRRARRRRQKTNENEEQAEVE